MYGHVERLAREIYCGMYVYLLHLSQFLIKYILFSYSIKLKIVSNYKSNANKPYSPVPLWSR